jgi:hypothetical protein
MISCSPGQVTFVTVKALWNDEESFIDISFSNDGVNIILKDDKNNVLDDISLNPTQTQVVKNLLGNANDDIFF